MTLLDQFNKYIRENNLTEPDDHLLLAVSGGVDSVVLTDLIYRSDCKFAIAHANFMLRGKDADEDQSFVKNLALKYQVPFHTTSFDTKRYARKNGISIEMAARELRFTWFDELSSKFRYSKIVLGTHQNDLIETMLLNLSKGTGIRGMRGILPKRGEIIRPLLSVSKSEILEYAAANKLKYRKDKSNDDIDLQRNRIRHKVIPELKKINPALEKNVCETALRFKSYEALLNEKLSDLKKHTLINKGDQKTEINLDMLRKETAFKMLLFEMLREFEIQTGVIDNILNLN